MAGQDAAAADRLRGYLRELKPGARALLIAELERGLLHGNGPAGAEMVLSELRRSFRESQSKSARFGDPARLFFQPVEPFLVDDGPDHKHRGRIARAALEPLWLWISNTLMPEDAGAYSKQVEHSLLAGDTEGVERHALAFQDRAVYRITEMLDSTDSRERRRLTVQFGTARALEDVQALRGIFNARDGLAMLNTQLPGHIGQLAGPVLESVKAHIDSPLAARPDLLLYSLVLVMSRLAAPWQLIRLATRAAGSDDAKRIAETPYVLAISIVLDEVDRRVARTRRRSQERPRHRGVGAAQGGARRAARLALRNRHVAGIRPGASISPLCAPKCRRFFPPRSISRRAGCAG